jgi:hypothetical protein
MQLCYGYAIPGQDIGRRGLRDPSRSRLLQWESIVNTSSPNLQLAPTQSDEYERRSRLVSLTYEVLRDMKTPTDEVTNMTMFSDLSRAFFEKATALANLEAAAPRVRGPKLPASMYSTRT